MTWADSKARTSVYLDSGVIVALALLCDMHHLGASRIFDAARKCGCEIVTSRLAIMEAVGVVRRRTAESHRRRSGSGGELAGVEAHVREAVSRMLGLVKSLEDADILHVVEADDSTFDLFLLQRKALEHVGRVITPAATGKRFRHRGVGSCDWLHFWLAKCIGADVICTTDMAFADIAGNDDEFGHIKVQTTRDPLIDLLGGDRAGGAA